MAVIRGLSAVAFCVVIALVLIGVIISEWDRQERQNRLAVMTARAEAEFWAQEASHAATEEAIYEESRDDYYEMLSDEATWMAEQEEEYYATEAAYEATEDVIYNAESATGAQAWCDPNYGATANGCVPGDRDHDCPELKAMGIGDVPVLGSDWQRLDGYFNYEGGYWESLPDGLGCEWTGE